MFFKSIAGALVAMSMAVSWQAQASLAWNIEIDSPDWSGTGTIVFTGPISYAGGQMDSFSFEGQFFGTPAIFGVSEITDALWEITPTGEINILNLMVAAPLVISLGFISLILVSSTIIPSSIVMMRLVDLAIRWS